MSYWEDHLALYLASRRGNKGSCRWKASNPDHCLQPISLAFPQHPRTVVFELLEVTSLPFQFLLMGLLSMIYFFYSFYTSFSWHQVLEVHFSLCTKEFQLSVLNSSPASVPYFFYCEFGVKTNKQRVLHSPYLLPFDFVNHDRIPPQLPSVQSPILLPGQLLHPLDHCD